LNSKNPPAPKLGGFLYSNKEKVKGLLKDFLVDWDAVMFDLHLGVLNKGGLNSFFPGPGRKSQFRARKFKAKT
jgi:hypothetical protein